MLMNHTEVINAGQQEERARFSKKVTGSTTTRSKAKQQKQQH